jgi:hypothetical protein
MQKPVVLALFLITTLVCSNAFAQALPPTDSTSEEAIVLGQSGLKNYHEERWQLALDDFQAAETKTHSPVFVLYAARCLRRQGHWVAALAKYRTLTSATAPLTVPEPWQQAYDSANAEFSELNATIPRLQFRLALGTEVIPSVRIDGENITFEAGAPGIVLDPGAHTLEVLHNGKTYEVRQLALHAGQVSTITLGPYPSERGNIAPSPLPVTLTRAPVTRQTARPESERPFEKVKPSSTVRDVRSLAFRVGLVSLAIGAIAGIFAWSERNAISGRCDDKVCPKELSSRIERGKVVADGATVALATGAVSFAVAGVLFYVAPSTSSGKNAGIEPQGLQVGLVGRY